MCLLLEFFAINFYPTPSDKSNVKCYNVYMGSPYKAIADDIRREILKVLSRGDTVAGDIAGKFNISKPAISNHLKILKEADLVREKKVQQNRIYSLNKNQIKKIISYLNTF